MKQQLATIGMVSLVLVLTACGEADPMLPTLASFPSATPSSAGSLSVSQLPSTTPSPAPILASPSETPLPSQTPVEASPTVTASPSETPLPSQTPVEVSAIIQASPTLTALPSETPLPTQTPVEVSVIIEASPTLTALPSDTLLPSATATTLLPTDTPSPSPTQTATLTPSPSKTLAPTQTEAATTEVALVTTNMTARVATEALNIRNGPGDEFDVIAYADEGVIVNVLGITEDQNWLWIEYGEPGQVLQGWIYTPMTELMTDSNIIPITEPTPLPSFTRLEGLTWIQQQFNNCAPTAVTIALTYFGGDTDQNIARAYLRPTFSRDVSVDILQMVDYINETQPGLRSVWRMGGNWTVIRKLIASGFPVIIETSVLVTDPEPGWAGHNRVIMGYDGDDILTYDSYLGHGNFEGYRIPQAELDELWRHMNRHFMVIYPIEREAEVAYIMGEMWQWPTSIRRSHDIALAEMRANPDNVFALFNLGATYTAQGDYEAAASAFDAAIGTGEIPFRIFWYQFSIFEAYYQVGRYNEVIYFAREALLNMGGYGAEELYYWLGMGYAGRGQWSEAQVQLENSLDFNSHFQAAQQALDQIRAGTFQPPV